MKTRYTFAAAIILAGLSSTASAYIYSENFDSMGTTGTAFPANWSMLYINGSGADLTIPTSAEMFSAVAGQTALAVWNQTSPGVEWLDQAANEGSTANDLNRLLGTSPTTVKGDMLQLSLVNASGGAISSVGISYQMKCMALGTLKSGFPSNSVDELPGYSFYYLDGSTWTHFASGTLDLANSTLNSVGTASGVITFSTPIANNGTMQFRWYDDNANAFSPDTMYAIDNVTVNIPEPAALSLLAVGALALICRRRKA